MGNFHCVPDGCGRVQYREYLPPAIRYRYEGEDWQEIVGADDYSTEKELGQCDTDYLVKGRHPINGLTYCGASWQTDPTPKHNWSIYTTGKVTGIKIVEYRLLDKYATNANGSCNTRNVIGTTRQLFAYLEWENQEKPSDGGISYFDESFIELFDAGQLIIIDSIERVDGEEDDCGNCKFQVYKNGEIVHSEARPECPEVEKLDCRLSDEFKEIKVEKTPYLQRIEVVPFGYGLQNLSGVPAPVPEQQSIPDECLNIYANEIYLPVPPDFPQGDGDGQSGFNFVAQICSAEGCPPPEYEVICNCDEECPPGTCEVACGSSLCCYDSNTGIAVKEIPISDFFPSNRDGGTSA